MSPVPCSHCGYNFMRQSTDLDRPRLCNNCDIRDKIRYPKEEKKMETVDVIVKCPKSFYNAIEESCINKGLSPSDYFMSLYFAEIGRGEVTSCLPEPEDKSKFSSLKGKKRIDN